MYGLSVIESEKQNLRIKCGRERECEPLFLSTEMTPFERSTDLFIAIHKQTSCKQIANEQRQKRGGKRKGGGVSKIARYEEKEERRRHSSSRLNHLRDAVDVVAVAEILLLV